MVSSPIDTLETANRLRPALLRVARELRRETESLGITSRQATLLSLIREHPGLSLRELAALERISAPSLSGHVDRLEDAGLIARVRSGGDRRRVGLDLTTAGDRLLRKVRAQRTTVLRRGAVRQRQPHRPSAATRRRTEALRIHGLRVGRTVSLWMRQ